MGRRKTTDPKLYWLASEGVYCANVGGVRTRFGPNEGEAERRRQVAVAEWLLRGRSPRPAAGVTVAELTTGYYRHCEERQAAGGLDGRQLDRIAAAVAAAQHLYGPEPAASFGPLKLQAVRDWLLQQPSKRPSRLTRIKRPPGRPKKDTPAPEEPQRPPPSLLSRNYVNRLVGCLQTCWGWAARRELVPGDLVHGLREVKSLRRKEGGREVPPRLPVPPEVVAATLPHCGPVVTAMVRTQRLAGMRPQDVCGLRPRMLSRDPRHVLYPLPNLPVSAFKDPETGVLLWVYCPEEHKGAWREKPRIVVLGPQAQAVLAPFLDGRGADAYVFSARESADAWRAERDRQAKYGRGREPGDHYSTQSYGRAVAAAVVRANRAGVAVPHWTPHQLRHDAATAATIATDEHTAAAVVGDHPDLMRTYARQAMRKAGGYAAKHG